MKITETKQLELTQYELKSKRLKGSSMKLLFNLKNSDNIDKVLVLNNIAAFIDTNKYDDITSIDIRDEAGTYGFDMACQLNRPEVEKYMEIFIWRSVARNYCFRALAEEVIWRNYHDTSLGDNNY